MTIIKIPPIVVENIAFSTKIGSDSEDTLKKQKDSLMKNVDKEYDENFHDIDVWHDDESLNSFSESMLTYFIISYKKFIIYSRIGNLVPGIRPDATNIILPELMKSEEAARELTKNTSEP